MIRIAILQLFIETGSVSQSAALSAVSDGTVCLIIRMCKAKVCSI